MRKTTQLSSIYICPSKRQIMLSKGKKAVYNKSKDRLKNCRARKTCLSSAISLSENPSDGKWGPMYAEQNVCNTLKFLLPWQLSTQKHHAHWLVSFLWPLPAAPAIPCTRNPQYTRQDIVIYRPRNAGRGFYDFRLRGKRDWREEYENGLMVMDATQMLF
jgi:hypothetical protein